uniref:Uncharacterized protein n=1 Tax=Rhizophora mucronata TaxID=61149 RepID=A0A2P2P7J6_RHIMU
MPGFFSLCNIFGKHETRSDFFEECKTLYQKVRVKYRTKQNRRDLIQVILRSILLLLRSKDSLYRD